jgi:hypothetical protein
MEKEEDAETEEEASEETGEIQVGLVQLFFMRYIKPFRHCFLVRI